MLLWSLASLCCLSSLIVGSRAARSPIANLRLADSERQAWRRALEGAERLRVKLESGVLPEAEEWTQPFQTPEAPTLGLVSELLARLRASGFPILPTLIRVCALLRDQLESERQARVKTAQARLQAWVSVALVPVLAAGLPLLLSGPRTEMRLWVAASLGASTLGVFSAAWIASLARRATRFGLSEREAQLPRAAPLVFEACLARLKGGTPPDLAWQETLSETARFCPDLDRLGSVLAPAPLDGDGSPAALFQRASQATLAAIRASLFEGRPCAERIEAIARDFGRELEAVRAREIELLASRALQPIFLCLAPAILGLLGLGLALEAASALGGAGIGGAGLG